MLVIIERDRTFWKEWPTHNEGDKLVVLYNVYLNFQSLFKKLSDYQ